MTETATGTAIVILAAGKGTRMKSRVPKVMHPMAGEPLLNHVVATARVLAPERLVLVLGPDMKDFAHSMPEAEVVIQQERLGSGHALLTARQALDGFTGDVLVLYGDVPLITPETLCALLEARRRGAAVAVLAFEPLDTAAYGRLELGPDGGLERIVERLDSNHSQAALTLCNSGIVAVDGQWLFTLLDKIENNNAKGEYYLTDIVACARALGLDCVYTMANEQEVLGVNDRVQLAEAEAELQNRLRHVAMKNGATLIDPASVWFSRDTQLGSDVTIGPHTWFGPGVSVADGVEIRAFCHLEGAMVGEGATIGPYARLRPGAEIGPGAHIGNFVEIKKARIEKGVKINHLSYIGDARVGAAANIGAGTITCNYDGFTKSLSDIGEGAFIGSNSALVAPVVIGEGAVVAAGSVIVSDVTADAIAVARGEQSERKGAAARRRARKNSGQGKE
ncbi:MAG: bifunctional N-acetylglucosamine-1-phosphate uridyltransferase/glucosamine-1-phosphate acetyltransferase [Rhodospirillaceae bacterium]|nr:bifunctional N-acetylglucosamine-1-phosphate uridyltransferase/glucosamine-1-phosphate acetyltransferase [Rhodospirillaceae bacterium]